MLKNCKYCNTKFRTKRKSKHFCSWACWAKLQTWYKEGDEFKYENSPAPKRKEIKSG